jgi:hypothetical protein
VIFFLFFRSVFNPFLLPQPLVVGGLLKYENKMAMMHYNVTRVREDGD